MITIHNTEQLDRFIRSTRGLYQNIMDSGKRLIGLQNPENRFSRLLRSYFLGFKGSSKVNIEIENIEFGELAAMYMAESKAFPRIR